MGAAGSTCCVALKCIENRVDDESDHKSFGDMADVKFSVKGKI